MFCDDCVHQLPMPTNDCLQSDDANNITKLANRSFCVFLYLGCQDPQHGFLSTIGPDRFLLFADHDIELMPQGDDF